MITVMARFWPVSASRLMGAVLPFKLWLLQEDCFERSRAMALSDELSKLEELRRRGVLTDEEFTRAKARLLDEPSGFADAPVVAAFNALRRSRSDRWIAGVCGGIARSTGVEPWVLRLAFALLSLWGGAGLLLYVLLWIFVPSE
jgi:phage shock protein PspC (stress-responsive transcriptional regulator)